MISLDDTKELELPRGWEDGVLFSTDLLNCINDLHIPLYSLFLFVLPPMPSSPSSITSASDKALEAQTETKGSFFHGTLFQVLVIGLYVSSYSSPLSSCLITIIMQH